VPRKRETTRRIAGRSDRVERAWWEVDAMRCNAVQTYRGVGLFGGQGRGIACHFMTPTVAVHASPSNHIVRGEVCSVQGYHDAD